MPSPTDDPVTEPPQFAQENQLPFRLRLLRWLGHQSWAPRGTDRILRALHHPDSGEHFHFEVPFFGKRYQGDLGHYIDWLVFSYGAAPHSELKVLADVTAFLRTRRNGPVTFFDIGANVGHHTLFMSGVADNIFAFEPFPKVREQLESKLALNALQNVRVVPVGLGEQDGHLPYFASTNANSGIGTFLDHQTSHYKATATLPVRRGDALFEQLDLPRLDILKIDVEGFEPQVLRGLRDRISQDRPFILMELLESTRAGFGSEEGLRDCFYEGAVLFGVEGALNRMAYRLTPFSFQRTEEILVLPAEYASFAEPKGASKREIVSDALPAGSAPRRVTWPR